MMELQVDDIVVMKKQHPCGSRRWQILRTGADLKLRCQGCGHEVWLPRYKAVKNIKSIEGKA